MKYLVDAKLMQVFTIHCKHAISSLKLGWFIGQVAIIETFLLVSAYVSTQACDFFSGQYTSLLRLQEESHSSSEDSEEKSQAWVQT